MWRIFLINMYFCGENDNNQLKRYTMKRLALAIMALLAFSFSMKAQMYVSTNTANRNVVIEDFTGRGCGYCPIAHRVMHELMTANPGRVWGIAVHSTGGLSPTTFPNLNTSISATLSAAFPHDGIPSGVFNRNSSSAIGINESGSTWVSYTNEQLGQVAECNVAGNVIVNPITRLATITVEVYYTGNSSVEENYLTVAMIQDSIIGAQSDYGNYNPGGWLNGQYVHMHVLRDIVTSVWGDAISPTTQGTLITRTYQYQIPETVGTPNGVAVDLNNVHFLAWVSERYQGTPTRPILNACELEYVQGVDEPIYPIVADIVMEDLYECTPSKNVELIVQNLGTEAINSMDITMEYGGETYTENWEGELPVYGREKIVVPVMAPFGVNDMVVSITAANGQPYDYTITKPINSLEWIDLEVEGEQETLKLMLMQDKYGNQITWSFTAGDGTVLASGGPYSILAGNNATQIHVENVVVPVNECVRFTIYDSMGDGICCTSGNGYYIVKDSHNRTLFGDNSDGDFGAEVSHMISIKSMDGVEEENEQSLRVYPNPTSSLLNIEGENMTSIEVYNALGQRVMAKEVEGNTAQISTESLNSGIYFLRAVANDGTIQNSTFTVAR